MIRALLSRLSAIGRGRAAVPLLIVALGAACFLFWHEAREARRAAARREASAASALAALSEVEDARGRLEAALKDHQEGLRGLERERAALRRKLEEVAEDDRTVRDWRGGSLPDSVRGLLADD